MSLNVLLHCERIGLLHSAGDTRVVSFTLSDAYAEALDRPVLGQFFEDRRALRSFRQTSQPRALPAFFANLLPEGALRALLAAQALAGDDLVLLARIGEDLPGAISVQPTEETNVSLKPRGSTYEEPALHAAATAEGTDASGLRFSLAGMQLKFSVERDQRIDSYLRANGHKLSFAPTARAFVERCLDVWSSQRQQVDARYGMNVDRHLGTLPLTRSS